MKGNSLSLIQVFSPVRGIFKKLQKKKKRKKDCLWNAYIEVKENKIHDCPDAWVTSLGHFLSQEQLFYKRFPDLCLNKCIH